MSVLTRLVNPTRSEAYAAFAAASSSYGLGALDHGDDDPGRKLGNWSSLIGIVTAIVGNVLIALALNVQRYAHIQLHRRRAQVRERARQAMKDASRNKANGVHNNGSRNGGYGSMEAGSNGGETATADQREGGPRRSDEREARESDPLRQSYSRRGQDGGAGEDDDEDDDDTKVASTYLRSPLWWLGQVLITVGEMGNFLAYGFAPASIVSPLGVVALISNCVIAPFLFKEIFRQRDFWGVIVAVAGAVTVVLSAKQQETKLEPHDVWDAITTMEFEIYLAVTCSLIAFLMWASPRYGNRTILIDLGLVGLFGGYTVLATKGVSSMLSSTLFRVLTTPVFYALVVVLLGTAIMQVRYVNKALQRFDSTQVIPIQFVLFTLSVITGSAVLYRDFERTSAEQALKFVGGCLLTFFGVFLITSGRPSADSDEQEGLSDEEGIEETIGLAEQGPVPDLPQTPQQMPSRRGSESARSRRSSRASRVSFLPDGVNRPLTVLPETGVPSLRLPAASNPRASFSYDGLADGSPIPDNPWRESQPQTPSLHPGMMPQTRSAESVLTMSSMGEALGTSPTAQLQPLGGTPVATIPPPTEPPATPRQPAHLSGSRPHSHHFSTPLYSPSPLSSTVSAVVADSLLRQLDSSPSARRLSVRRSRPGLRNSLFIPRDELDASEAGGGDTDVSSSSNSNNNNRPGTLFPPPERGDDDHDDDHDEGEHLLGSGAGGKKTIRTRARSLSNALGDLFGRKRQQRRGRRRGMSADAEDAGGGGGGAASSSSASSPPPVGQSAAAQRSATSLETL